MSLQYFVFFSLWTGKNSITLSLCQFEFTQLFTCKIQTWLNMHWKKITGKTLKLKCKRYRATFKATCLQNVPDQWQLRPRVTWSLALTSSSCDSPWRLSPCEKLPLKLYLIRGKPFVNRKAEGVLSCLKTVSLQKKNCYVWRSETASASSVSVRLVCTARSGFNVTPNMTEETSSLRSPVTEPRLNRLYLG